MAAQNTRWDFCEVQWCAKLRSVYELPPARTDEHFMHVSSLGRSLLFGLSLTAAGTLRPADAAENTMMRVSQNSRVAITLASFRATRLLYRTPGFITVACSQAQANACANANFACPDRCGVNKSDSCITQCHNA